MTIWKVPGEVLRVVDGDTVRIRLDLGWAVFTDKNCRVLGVNSPELATAEGKTARDFTAQELPAGSPVTFVSHELDKYGRPLGQVLYGPIGSRDLGSALLAAGHAVAYTP